MSYEYIVIWVLSGVVAVETAVICGGITGVLHHLGGNPLPAVLLKAGTAFGAFLTLSAAMAGLVISKG
ncbi:hypothetical protein ACFY8O_06260 [Streptomyces argenteolus]|uniref:Uncharacterized protein n=1 Tax=Streptomyces argenteolus TaxID=67274 RepID=A0ABW6X0E7_9ACTN